LPRSETTYYDNYWRGSSGWIPSDSLDYAQLQWIKLLANPGSKLLDVGCGDGSRYAQALLKAGIELHGIDVSHVAVEKATQNNIQARQGTLDERLPYLDGQFDAAICLEVFQHLLDPEYSIREIFRVLRPGGLLLTSVPNVANWRSRFDMLFFGRVRTGGSPRNRRYPWGDPHLRMFNLKALGDLAGDVGFQVERKGGLHTNFLEQAPGIRRLTRWRTMKLLNSTCRAIGRRFPSLLAGRCILLARKPADPAP